MNTHKQAMVTSLSRRAFCFGFWGVAAGISTSNFGSLVTEPA